MVKLQEQIYKDAKGKEHKKYYVLLPLSIVKLKGLKKGDEIDFEEEKGKIFLNIKKA